MRCFFILWLIIGSVQPLLTQTDAPVYLKYLVEFSDKNNNPFSVKSPTEFLSPRALARRKKYNIPVTESDLPVNPSYLTALESFTKKIHHSSKWMNTALVTADSKAAEEIAHFPFVKSVRYVGKPAGPNLLLRRSNKKRDSESAPETTEHPHGFAELQNETINIQPLHDLNYRGAGILIAVLDGGFTNTDIMPFFDNVRAESRFLPGRDFTDDDDFVYESTGHGSQVLSVMAADIPYLMVGTAPDATYVCLKTEDTGSEYPAEEVNWVAALEYADSLGADIINSSLGYTTFSDKTFDYAYANLDGKTAFASQAADMAFEKGIIIVSAVGNEGNTPWKYLDVPADAEGVLAVGATDQAGYKARFSSYGPTADGRIKPDVSGPGQDVAVASVYTTEVKASKGTSFSAPLIAGAVAALWQAVPYRSPEEILEAVKLSADRATRPDNQTGYGIPDFAKAWELLR